MPDTGWITPQVGTVQILDIGSENPINAGNITNSDLSSFMTMFIVNDAEEFVGTGSNLTLWSYLDPANYPGDAVVTGIEFRVIGDYTTENPSSGDIDVWVVRLEHQNDSPAIHSDSSLPLDPPGSGFVYKSSGDPDGSDLVFGGPTEIYGFDGWTVNEMFTRKLGDVGSIDNFQTWIRFDAGNGTPGQTAILRVATVQIKVYWEIPAVNIDIDADVSISALVNPDLSHLIDFSSENVALSIEVTSPDIESNINMFADVGIMVDPYGVISDIDFIDNDGQVYISVDFEAELTRYGNMRSDIFLAVSPFAETLSYGRIIEASVAIGVNIEVPLIEKICIITANVFTDILVIAPAPDGSILLEANVPISAVIDADLDHDYAMVANVPISVDFTSEVLKEQYLYSNVPISVIPDAELTHLVNMHSDLNISIIIDGSISFGPTQSDVLSERRMVIEPKERTMLISPSDRTVTIDCP